MTKYRSLPVAGLYNVRDLGGYAAEGGVTKYGVFVRSEVPKDIREEGVRFLRGYGITASLDLRGEGECRQFPSLLRDLPGHRYVVCPMIDEKAAAGADMEKVQQQEMESMVWLPAYIAMTENGKAWVRQVLTIAADCEGGLLFHCFTGKDRTGILSALLLGLCGVSRYDIISDYSQSMIYLRPFYEQMPPIPGVEGKTEKPDYYGGFFRTGPETMEGLIDHWEARYGGIVPFIQACGLPEATVEKLKSKFIEQA